MKRLFVLLLVVAGGLAAAAFTVPSDAATVNGHGIGVSSLDNDLAAIDASPGYQCYLQASVLLDSQGQAQLPVIGGVSRSGGPGSGGTYDAAFVRYWLSRMVSTELVAQQASARDLAVTPADEAAAKAESEQIITGTFATLEQNGIQPRCSPVPSGPQVFASLPAGFVDSLARAQATSDLMAAHVVGSDLSAGSMDRYFAAHRADFDTFCVGGFAVSTQAAAAQIRATIAAGTPFAKAVPAGSTVQSACFSPTSSSYQAISSAVGSLAVGGVSQPLASSSGAYYLFQLTQRTPATLATSRPVLRGAIVNAGLKRADQLLIAAERRSAITVDPRYGTWTVSAAAVGVRAPASPPPSSLLSPVANDPSAPRYAGTGTSAGSG